MKKRTSANEIKQRVTPSKIMVLISKEISFENSEDSYHHLEIINLRHPREGKSTCFMYNSEKGTIQEIMKFSEKHRSWFIGNSVVSDGNMYLATPVDPLFLILPYLNQSKMSSTLDQLIHDEEFSDSVKLESLVDEEQLSLISNKKDCGGLIVWKYNEEKTLTWLRNKVNKVAKVLERNNINVNTACAVSKTFVKTTKESPENYLRYSHGIVSEYLQPEISDKLLTSLNLPPIESANTKKRKNPVLDSEEIKRLRKECFEKDVVNVEGTPDTKTEKIRKNPKQAALAKAAAGTKSISSFFKKNPTPASNTAANIRVEVTSST